MGFSTSMFASKRCIHLAPASQPGSFFPPPLGKQSLNASTYLLSLQTTLIQSFFHRQGEFLAPNLSFLQHCSDGCVNGELSEMALLYPRCLLIM
jgi:hypothetical protein